MNLLNFSLIDVYFVLIFPIYAQRESLTPLTIQSLLDEKTLSFMLGYNFQFAQVKLYPLACMPWIFKKKAFFMHEKYFSWTFPACHVRLPSLYNRNITQHVLMSSEWHFNYFFVQLCESSNNRAVMMWMWRRGDWINNS